MSKLIGWILMPFGAGLLALGILWWRSDVGAMPIVLAEVEDGMTPSGDYWRIGQHDALLDLTIVVYDKQTMFNRENKFDASTTVRYAYYPILASNRGGAHPIAVLVRTKKFKKAGDIPTSGQLRTGVEGRVTSRASSLPSQDQEFLRKSMPRLDLDHVWLLEENCIAFSSAAKALLMVLGAVALISGLLFATENIEWIKAWEASRNEED